jgi:DNA-binding response OmpR family regulator
MKKILLVDDDKLLRDSLAKVLSARGYEVQQAGDGEEAFSAAQNNVPNLIITDIMMPKLSGLDLMEKIRHTVWGEHVPIIVLTIKDQDIEDVNRTIQARTVAYLSKSEISPDGVAALVDQYLTEKP